MEAPLAANEAKCIRYFIHCKLLIDLSTIAFNQWNKTGVSHIQNTSKCLNTPLFKDMYI